MLVCLSSSPAQSVKLRVFGQTTAQGYQHFTSGEQVLNRRRIVQDLGLLAYDMTSSGRSWLNLVTHMRFDSDLGVSPREAREFDLYNDAQLLLMTAYLEGRRLWNHLDFKLGRQLIVDHSRLLSFDGIWLSSYFPTTVGTVGGEVFVGLEVRHAVLPMNFHATELDGTYGNSDSRLVTGAAASFEHIRNHSFRLAYTRLLRATGGQHSFAGRTLESSPGEVAQEQLSLHLRQALGDVGQSGILAVWDLVQNEPAELLVSPQLRLLKWLELSVHHWYIRPSYDAEAIWNVFEAYPMHEVGTGIEIQPLGSLWVRLSYSHRWYIGTASDGSGDSVTTNQAVSGAISWQAWNRGVVAATVSYHTGMGGYQLFGDFSCAHTFSSVPLALEGRLTGVRWNLDIGSYSNAMALGVAAGLRYRIGAIASLFLLVEENVSSFYGSRLRAMLLFQVDTWL